MLVIVLLVPGLVGQVPMAVLAALMIMAGHQRHRLPRSALDLEHGRRGALVHPATFLATLVLSVPVAVGAGVLLTIVLFFASSASDVTVRALVPIVTAASSRRRRPGACRVIP